MRITRYRPIVPEPATWPRGSDIAARFNRMFDDFLTQPEPMSWSPAVDVVEKDDELVLTAEMPGLKKEDVQLEVADGVLTLKGEKRVEKEEKEENYRLWERSYGAFERTFALPRSIATDRIGAEFESGVLKVHLPKTEKAVGKKVEIAGR